MKKSVNKLRLIILMNLVNFANQSDSGIFEITKETYFPAELSKGKYIIFLGTPTCPYCERLIPVWLAISDVSYGNGVVTAAVNCLTDEEICQDLGVSKYPTIYFVSEGNIYEFSGPRSAESISAFYKEGYKNTQGVSIQEIKTQKISQKIDTWRFLATFDEEGLVRALLLVLGLLIAIALVLKKTSTKNLVHSKIE